MDRFGLIVFLNAIAATLTEPCLQAAWIICLCLAATCMPVASDGEHSAYVKRKHKRKRRPPLRSFCYLKREVCGWARRAAKNQRCIFSCRIVQKRRFTRTGAHKRHLKKVCWWLPESTQVRRRASEVSFVPGAPLGQAIVHEHDTQEFDLNFRTMSGGKGGAAATRRRRQEHESKERKGDLALALSGFLATWTSQKGWPPEQDQSRQQETSLAKAH